MVSLSVSPVIVIGCPKICPRTSMIEPSPGSALPKSP
jgi:hypothetical protein